MARWMELRRKNEQAQVKTKYGSGGKLSFPFPSPNQVIKISG